MNWMRKRYKGRYDGDLYYSMLVHSPPACYQAQRMTTNKTWQNAAVVVCVMSRSVPACPVTPAYLSRDYTRQLHDWKRLQAVLCLEQMIIYRQEQSLTSRWYMPDQ